jgi:hypothetical protein
MAFQPMPLSRRPLPFDHAEWIFELKYDGFRALAVIDNGRTQLISRERPSLQLIPVPASNPHSVVLNDTNVTPKQPVPINRVVM